MLLSLVLAVAFSILAVFFANYNQTVVQVSLFGYVAKGSLGVIIVVAVGVGVLLGVLVMLPSIVSRSWALIRHKRKIEDLQSAMQQSTQKEFPPE
jgi:putative membrane protein